MVRLSHICRQLERFAMINFHRHASSRQETLKNLHVYCNFAMFLAVAVAQLYSTVTRAIRYYPEFNQGILMSTIQWYHITFAVFFRHKYQILNSCSDQIDEFSRADPKVVTRCYRECTITCYCVISVAFAIVMAIFGETLLSIPDSEIALLGSIYGTQQPERRHPLPARIPFLDESKSWTYEVVYACELYTMFHFAIYTGLSVCIFPVAQIQMRGQYEMLCRHISMIGREHRDAAGNRIYYHSIEKNEYSIKLYTPPRLGREREAYAEQEARYEEIYLRQIVVFHQRLLNIQMDFAEFLSPLILGFAVVNNLGISLCLYQLLLSTAHLSIYRYLKFLLQFSSMLVTCFIMCNVSEGVDDFYCMMRRAIASSDWNTVTNRTRRDMCFILTRVQSTNHNKFCGGALVPNRLFFLNVVKASYSFVNFVSLMMSRG